MRILKTYEGYEVQFTDDDKQAVDCRLADLIYYTKTNPDTVKDVHAIREDLAAIKDLLNDIRRKL